ncbi:MAG TPA: type II toxin-antitoxin system HicA family toxin [Candidatus Nitrosotenuis sp.]|nr:type II toxin-antitoxin system HicA family toxin [Candidatus Nitrosotenuis sp.]
MKRLSPIHGRELVKILCNKFDFQAIRQKGSHVTITNGTIYVTVPIKEIRVGLLGVILRDCGITREEFLKVV